MALRGPNVQLIPESVVTGETLTDDTITVDYNLPPNKRAAQTPRLGDPYPGDTSPWGFCVIETGSFTTPRGVDRGAYLTGVKYGRPKVPFTSGITGLYEVERKFETGRLGRYLGTRVFLLADDGAETLAESALPEGKPMQASGLWKDALLRQKEVERRWRYGIARVTAQYDTYSEWGEFEHVGKGILEADMTAVMQWNRDNVPGTDYRIDEIYVVGGVRKQWVRVKGNNAWPLVKANLRIRVLLNDSNLVAVKARAGCTNTDDCPNILGAKAGQLWFNNFQMRQRKRGEGRLYDALIGLAADPDGWDSQTQAQLQKFWIQEEVAHNAAGAELGGPFERTGSWIPDSAAEPTKMPLSGATASFALFNGYLD